MYGFTELEVVLCDMDEDKLEEEELKEVLVLVLVDEDGDVVDETAACVDGAGGGVQVGEGACQADDDDGGGVQVEEDGATHADEEGAG